MIVRMRSCAQAAKVAEATGGVQLAGKPKPDGTPTFSRYVEIGVDFEAHRPVVESVSVLFELYDGDANSYAATGGPGAQLPSGWMVTAAKFEVEWPADPQRAGLVRSHFGARRKAFNWGLAQVKADLDAKAADPAHESVDWDLKSLDGRGTEPKMTWRRGGPRIPRSATRRGWPIWPRAWLIGKLARTGPAKAGGWASRDSNPGGVILAGCGSPPAPCA